MNDTEVIQLVEKLSQYSGYAAFIAAYEWIKVMQNPHLGSSSFDKAAFTSKLPVDIQDMLGHYPIING